MIPLTSIIAVLPFGLAVVCMACGSTTSTTPALTQVPLPPWDGGADAGCSIATTSVRVQCTTAYRIEGDPRTCPGFDSQGTGSTAACTAACRSGLVCSLSGLSDGTSAVVCESSCASPEH
jgi:hypothetical protein